MSSDRGSFSSTSGGDGGANGGGSKVKTKPVGSTVNRGSVVA